MSCEGCMRHGAGGYGGEGTVVGGGGVHVHVA